MGQQVEVGVYGDTGSQDVVKIVVYVTEHAHRRHVYPVIDEFFGALKPCSTGLVVSGLDGSNPTVLSTESPAYADLLPGSCAS